MYILYEIYTLIIRLHSFSSKSCCSMQFEVFIMHSNQIKKSREDVWLSSSIWSSFHQISFCTSKKCIIIVKTKQFSELQICPLLLSEKMRRDGFRDLHALNNLTNNIFLLETVQNVHIFCDRLLMETQKMPN